MDTKNSDLQLITFTFTLICDKELKAEDKVDGQCVFSRSVDEIVYNCWESGGRNMKKTETEFVMVC